MSKRQPTIGDLAIIGEHIIGTIVGQTTMFNETRWLIYWFDTGAVGTYIDVDTIRWIENADYWNRVYGE